MADRSSKKLQDVLARIELRTDIDMHTGEVRLAKNAEMLRLTPAEAIVLYSTLRRLLRDYVLHAGKGLDKDMHVFCNGDPDDMLRFLDQPMTAEELLAQEVLSDWCTRVLE